MKANTQYALRLLALGAAGLLCSFIGARQSNAGESSALTGVVSSDQEPQMEGVLVSAKKVSGNITVTVVSDSEGRYSFPGSRLQPGKYHMSVRAVGYDLADLGEIEVLAKKTTQKNLKLQTTAHLAEQLSNIEWMMSIPGTLEQKKSATCMFNCHSPGVALASKYDARAFLPVLNRMHNYFQGSFYVPGVVRLAVPNVFKAPPNPRDPKLAEYLSSINLSSSTDGKWKYDLQTLPRPRGKSTRVIITEYDTPRREFEPHDVAVDAEGMIWTADFGGPYLARLNPRTGEIKEWEVPNLKPDQPGSALDLQFDKDDNPWFSMMDQGGLAKFDKKTEKISTWSVPEEYNNEHARTGMVAISADGLVWFKDSGNARVYRLNPKTNHMDAYHLPSEFYGMRLDSQGNLFLSSLEKGTIGRIDAETGTISVYPTPTPDSGAHRGEMDGHDRYWFAESHPGQIGMFDTRTQQFKEWPLPFKEWSDPYEASPEKNGDIVWAAGETTDYVYRLDPKTGQVTSYLLPSIQANFRRVTVDNSTNPVTVWIGENHQGKIAKLEVLE